MPCVETVSFSSAGSKSLGVDPLDVALVGASTGAAVVEEAVGVSVPAGGAGGEGDAGLVAVVAVGGGDAEGPAPAHAPIAQTAIMSATVWRGVLAMSATDL